MKRVMVQYKVKADKADENRQLIEAVFAALGRQPLIDYIPTPESLRDKYQYFTCAEMDRLRAAGYKAQFTPLEDVVGTYVGDFLNSGDPYI